MDTVVYVYVLCRYKPKVDGGGGHLWSVESARIHVPLQADLPSCPLPEHTGHTGVIL